MGFCNCSMFCCTLLYVPSSFAIILMGKRELVALLSMSSCCLMIVVWLFLAVPWVCLQFVIVVFPDNTQLLFLQWLINDLFQRKNIIFRGFRWGLAFSRGVQLFPRAMLISIDTHRTCDFPGWAVRTPVPSSGSAHLF